MACALVIVTQLTGSMVWPDGASGRLVKHDVSWFERRTRPRLMHESFGTGRQWRRVQGEIGSQALRYSNVAGRLAGGLATQMAMRFLEHKLQKFEEDVANTGGSRFVDWDSNAALAPEGQRLSGGSEL